MERLILQNEAHKAELGQSLVHWLASGLHSDVTFHFGQAGRSLTCHRLVLGSMSEYLRDLLASGEESEHLHVSLPEMEPEAMALVCQFAYQGTVKIPKAQVEPVCEAAQRLKIKFLRDSFVKINQKDFQAMREGRKGLKTPLSPRVSAPSPQSAPGPNAEARKPADSDTDSAESDEENNSNATGPTPSPAATLGAGKTTRVTAVNRKRAHAPPNKSKTPKSPPKNIMFTLTKQVEDKATSSVTEAGNLLVHFQKGNNAENKNPSSPVKLISPPVQKRVILTTAPPVSAALAAQRPVLPMPMGLKKVVIPPMARCKLAATPAKVVIAPSGASVFPGGVIKGGSQLVALSSTSLGAEGTPLQVQTVRQADGREIRVIRKPVGTMLRAVQPKTTPTKTITAPIMKTMVSPTLTKVPKDVLATAMQAIAATTSAEVVGSPTRTMPGFKAMSPNAAVIRIASPPRTPASPQKGTTTSIITLPAKPALKTNSTRNNAPAVNPAPGTPGLITGTSKADRLSVSAPKPGIPATVPDDFLEDLMDDKSSASGSSGSDGTRASDKKANATRSNKKAPPKAKTNHSHAQKEDKPPVEVDPNVRSSGRARKINPKYRSDKSPEAKPNPPPQPPSPAKKIPIAPEKPPLPTSSSSANLKKRKIVEPSEPEVPTPPKVARSRRGVTNPPEPRESRKLTPNTLPSNPDSTKPESTNNSKKVVNPKSGAALLPPRKVPLRSAKSESNLPEKRVRKQRVL